MRFNSRLRDCWRRDWISVDGGNEGQVIEINWRATRVRDRNGDTMVIPNSQIAKSRVTNHSLPERVHPSSINVDIEAGSSADTVETALVSAGLQRKACAKRSTARSYRTGNSRPVGVLLCVILRGRLCRHPVSSKRRARASARIRVGQQAATCPTANGSKYHSKSRCGDPKPPTFGSQQVRPDMSERPER